ncbi:toxin Doc (plasmid) [Streptomyces sp. BI20]|uniref:toxin Doc n=1 Tax=Streptomyces sp. BI20 TaxID=3403460 RepID=UPI003C76E381
MDLHIDIRWLLERQVEVLPTQPAVHDYSALAAAVGRHRVRTPSIDAEVDNAWRAAVLMHTVIRLRPLPARNALFGAALAVAYLYAADEEIEIPHGGLVDLARAIHLGRADAFDTAVHLRAWLT